MNIERLTNVLLKRKDIASKISSKKLQHIICKSQTLPEAYSVKMVVDRWRSAIGSI